MNGEILLLFVILLLALILSTYLGGENGIYPIVEGMTSNSKAFTYTNSTTYVAKNGSTAEITSGTKGNNFLTITTSDGKIMKYETSSGADINTFYASDGKGGRAVITNDFTGKPTLTVTDTNGNKIIFNVQKKSNSYFSNSYDNYNHYTGSSHASIHYGPDGGTAKIINTGNDGTIVITNKNGETDIFYIDKTPNSSPTTYVGPNGSIAKIIKDTSGKSAVELSDYKGTKFVYTEDDIYNNNPNIIEQALQYNGYEKYTKLFDNSINNSSGIYNNSLPQGIPRNQIPAGQEDLYILKSQVVPPVCPKCPDPIVRNDSNNGNGEFDVSKCPPCPGPMRCPEPSFDCKKVPNYKAFNQDFMPIPVLNSFSTFGM